MMKKVIMTIRKMKNTMMMKKRKMKIKINNRIKKKERMKTMRTKSKMLIL